MKDEQIIAALAEVGADWLMDPKDELYEVGAVRHLCAAVELAVSGAKDAERYRKLRTIAVESGELEAVVAIGQFDYIRCPEEFDAAVDASCGIGGLRARGLHERDPLEATV